MKTRTVWINATTEDGELLDRISVEVPNGEGRLTICKGDPCLHNELGELGIGVAFESGFTKLGRAQKRQPTDEN